MFLFSRSHFTSPACSSYMICLLSYSILIPLPWVQFIIKNLFWRTGVNRLTVFCSTFLYPRDWCQKLLTFYVEFCSWLRRKRALLVSIGQLSMFKFSSSVNNLMWSTVDRAPVVQRLGNFIQWISHYLTVSICAKISVFPIVQGNMHTLTTAKFGSVRKPWTTFNVKYTLNPE